MKSRLLASFLLVQMSFIASAHSQSIECQLLRNEILQQHQSLNTDRCKMEHEACMRVRGGQPGGIAVCSGVELSCRSGQSMGNVFGAQQREIQSLNQKIQVYKANCER